MKKNKAQHYAQGNTNNVNKTLGLLTKDEPNIVNMRKS